MPPTSDDDTFDPNEYVRAKDHAKDFEELKGIINRLNDRFGDDTKFGNTFEEMATDSRKVDKVIKDTLRRLIKSDEETGEVIKGHVAKVDRDWRAKFAARVGIGIWTLVTIAAGALIEYLIQYH